MVGSGGQRRRALTGKGPTPPADQRPGHPAARRGNRHRSRSESGPRREVILGRNAVDEAVAAGVPAIELAVGDFLTDDPRTSRAKRAAQEAGIPVNVRTKSELDQLGDGLPHQGIALVVAPFEYVELHDVIEHRPDPDAHPVVVALDHLQDGRNLGCHRAVRCCVRRVRFGPAQPPRRRSHCVGVAIVRRTLSRVPVARVVNMARALTSLRKAGFAVVGLATVGGTAINHVDPTTWDQPIAIVVGNEATGISQLVTQRCDLLVTIPIAGTPNRSTHPWPRQSPWIASVTPEQPPAATPRPPALRPCGRPESHRLAPGVRVARSRQSHRRDLVRFRTSSRP